MMKNVAIPVSAIRLKAVRESEIKRLNELATMPASQKISEIEIIDLSIAAIVKDSAKKKKQIAELYGDSEEKSLERSEAYSTLLREQDEVILPLQKERERLALVVTDEEKAEQLAIHQQAHDAYGVKEMNVEEIAANIAKEIEHDDYVKNTKYRDDRAQEYPSVGDQLDAIWAALRFAQVADYPGLDNARAMIQKIDAVKAKFPKPEGK